MQLVAGFGEVFYTVSFLVLASSWCGPPTNTVNVNARYEAVGCSLSTPLSVLSLGKYLYRGFVLMVRNLPSRLS